MTKADANATVYEVVGERAGLLATIVHTWVPWGVDCSKCGDRLMPNRPILQRVVLPRFWAPEYYDLKCALKLGMVRLTPIDAATLPIAEALPSWYPELERACAIVVPKKDAPAVARKIIANGATTLESAVTELFRGSWKS